MVLNFFSLWNNNFSSLWDSNFSFLWRKEKKQKKTSAANHWLKIQRFVWPNSQFKCGK
jgi:hypothetical protein